MKTYLVTGAAGFIGSAIAQTLIDSGNRVVTVDNLSTGFKNSIPKGVEFFKGNCQDINVINNLNSYSFDAIYHIAGQSSGEISFDDPVYDLQTNAQSTLLLLKLALKTGCNKFIYASTMSVYGDQPDEPVGEEAVLSPKSFYGVGKVASEHYLRLYKQYGIQSTALRLFNVYGPGQNMDNLRQGMVSIFLAQAFNNRHVIVKGDKNRYRDFVYIDDVVDAFLNSLKSRTGFEVINICTGLKTTIEAVLDTIADMVPFGFSTEFSDNTPGDQFGIVGDPAKASIKLNWQPKVSFEEGLSYMINWLQDGNGSYAK